MSSRERTTNDQHYIRHNAYTVLRNILASQQLGHTENDELKAGHGDLRISADNWRRR